MCDRLIIEDIVDLSQYVLYGYLTGGSKEAPGVRILLEMKCELAWNWLYLNIDEVPIALKS